MEKENFTKSISLSKVNKETQYFQITFNIKPNTIESELVMSKETNTFNPFARLKKSDFPDKPIGKSDKDCIPKTKIITPKKQVNTLKSNASHIDKNDQALFQEEEESSLFFANMAQVQKLPLSTKELKRKQGSVKKANQNKDIKDNTDNLFAEQSADSNPHIRTSKEKCEQSIAQKDTPFSVHANTQEYINSPMAQQKTAQPDTIKHGTTKNESTKKSQDVNPLAKSLQNLLSSNNADLNTKKLPQKEPIAQQKNSTIKANNSSSNTLDISKKYTIISNKNNTNTNIKNQKNRQNSNTDNKNLNQATACLNSINNDEVENSENDLFLSTFSDVQTLQSKGRDIPLTPQAPVQAPEIQAKNINPIQEMISNSLEIALHTSEDYIEAHVLGLDLTTVAKLQSREYKPEAHIDLHGLTIEHAYNNLIAFFRNAYQRGLRTVLVVTGKGINSINNTPILRTKTSEWFTQDPFRRVILAFCSAKIEDGGSGALYVLIRKPKKDYGAIDWNMTPNDPELFL